MIRFHVLGAGGAVPTATHSPAAYLVTVDETPILLDPGPGALVRHARCGEAPGGVDDIGRVLVTHLHPDHCADLTALLFAVHSIVPESTEPLCLFGPVGLAEHLEALHGVWGRWLEPRRRELVVKELEPGDEIPLPDGARVAAFAARHDQDRLARRPLGFTFCDADGRRAVFSGDTERCPGLEEAARGADLLVVECSMPDELATPGHMTPTAVGELCAAARPRQVVLTHQYPAAAALDLEHEIGKIFDGPVNQAQDGGVYVAPDHENDAPDIAGDEEKR